MEREVEPMRFSVMHATTTTTDAAREAGKPPVPGAVLVDPDEWEWEIEIATLDDVMRLASAVGHDLIISPARNGDGLPTLTVFDDRW